MKDPRSSKNTKQKQQKILNKTNIRTLFPQNEKPSLQKKKKSYVDILFLNCRKSEIKKIPKRSWKAKTLYL